MITNGKNKTYLLFLMLLVSLTACGENGKEYVQEQDTALSYTVDTQADSLTIAGPKKEPMVYTEDELEALGFQTHTYSARGKEQKNARQFLSFSGVELDTLLEDAGYPLEDAAIKVFCSDGYVREYDVEDLFDLYAYADNDSDDGVQVPPMIALGDEEEGWEYPSPFRLVYGQADYDTADSMDFNMQGWARYVQYIEVSYNGSA